MWGNCVWEGGGLGHKMDEGQRTLKQLQSAEPPQEYSLRHTSDTEEWVPVTDTFTQTHQPETHLELPVVRKTKQISRDAIIGSESVLSNKTVATFSQDQSEVISTHFCQNNNGSKTIKNAFKPQSQNSAHFSKPVINDSMLYDDVTSDCHKSRSVKQIKGHNRHSGVSASPVISSVFVIVIIVLCAFARPALCQCSDDKSCIPEIKDLVDLSFETRHITVSSQCGAEDNTNGVYRRIKTTLDDTDFTCSTNEHTKEDMTDYKVNERIFSNTTFTFTNADLDTYWQSENSVTNITEPAREEFVVFDMGDPFLIRSVMVIFVSPHTEEEDRTMDMRPRAVAIDIKVDGVWKTVRYYAADCQVAFPDATFEESGPNYNATTPVCKEEFYSTDEATFTGWTKGTQQRLISARRQTLRRNIKGDYQSPFIHGHSKGRCTTETPVSFSPSTEYSPEFDRDADIQRYYTATAIKVRMTAPADNFELSSYYAIGDFEVNGDCSCYGHADTCTGANEEMCVCGHHTTGDHCEQCLPLYNNKPWAVGYLNQANPCELCGCNDHAVSCVYDPDKGYGVCDGCTNQTAGDKCEWCVPHYYVNPDRETYNASVDPVICTALNGSVEISYDCGAWCIPCNCSQEGTIANEMTCNNGTGQCSCKSFVEGRLCDVCMDGYWNLQGESLDGCQECVCSEVGTVNGSLCDKVTGTCTCKLNVMGSDCDQCKPGTFNLSAENPKGCTSCGCDLGAAMTSTCNNQTGVCDCREGIQGRECDRPMPAYYIPQLDYLTFEAELADDLGDFVLIERSGHGTVDTTLTGRGFVQLPQGSSLELEVVVPETFDYNVIIRYESSSAWSNFGVVFRAVNASQDPSPTYECAGGSHDITADLYDSADIPAAESRGGVELASRDMCLRASTLYTVSISVPQSQPEGGLFLLDSIVLLPNYTLLAAYNDTDSETQALMDTCYQYTIPIDLQARQNLSCSEQEYSIMAEFFGQAMPCFCDEGGSSSSVCDPFSGQCECKPNVILQDCSQCSVGFYNFTSGEGCTACNCDALGSLPRTCNETGTCLCQPNVIGEKCDECLPNHYGINSGEGCTPCTCNELYSMNNSCIDDGQCLCKPAVGGVNCDQCIDGAYNLTSFGCEMCGCDEEGSFEEGCNPDDGTCLCRRNVEGSKCDTCKQGYYGLGSWTPLGCLQCVCSGHSNNCTSAPGWFKTKHESNWSLLDGEQAIQDIWTGVDELGNPITVRDLVVIDNDGSQYVMRLYNSNENLDKMLYFVATEPYLGNKQSAYNQMLNITLGYFLPGPQEEGFEPEYINGSDVILQGLYTDFTLVARLPRLPVDTPTSYGFTLNEEQWRVDSPDGSIATYTQMISVLSQLGAIWVRAKYTNVTNSYGSLYGASIEFSARENATTEISANNIEQCVCPEEYTGQYCESCSPGYQHNPHNSGPFAECIPCACNNHGLADISCDPESGMCTCVNNTVGDHCELCADGYYGDATDGTPEDCQVCMCPGNVVESALNVFAKTCELKSGGGFTCTDCAEGHGGDRCEYCIENYYGTPLIPLNNNGECAPCECNGRADTCNSTTGICTECRNNTAGKECEICAEGYFGDAMAYNCQPCSCSAVGATGSCHPVSGRCECHPNVLGLNCEGPCDTNTFNYSSGQGCEPCACHIEGATLPSCDMETGQCECRDHVVGRQCDECEDTYWDISPFGCSGCDCTEAGTLNDTSSEGDAVFGVCELESGQCECALPGIIGRTCDQCATGTLGVTYKFVADIYIGTYPQCELCGECYDNWARKIDEVGLKIEELYIAVLRVWSSYNNLTTSEVQPTLDSLRSNLTGVTSSIQMAQDMVNSLTYLEDGFIQVMERVENLTAMLDSIKMQYLAIQQLLDSIQAYDGATETQSGSSLTPTEINQNTIELLSNVEELFQTGNVSYLRIQEMSNIIATSSSRVQNLMNNVSLAMQALGNARLTRETAAILLSGAFATSFNNTAQTLINLQENLDSVNEDIIRVNGSSIDNAVAMASTNTSVYENLELSENKKVVSQETMREAQSAMANVTQAEAAVARSVTEVRSYRTTAISTKEKADYLIEQIVLENLKIPPLNVQKTNSQRMVANIDAIELQPLSDMQSLVADIDNTSVSQSDVNVMLEKASAATQTAEQAQDITELAEQESQMTLEYVRQINNNLQEGSRTNDTVINDLDRTKSTVADVEETLSEVQSRTENATLLAEETEVSLASAEIYLESVSQCFNNTIWRTENARHTADSAQAFLRQVVSLQSESEESASQASVRIQETKSLTENAFDQVLGVQDDMNSLQAQMDALEETTTLQALYNDMVSQLVQMELLERDLATCDTDIDELLTSLTNLQEAPQVTCTHN